MVGQECPVPNPRGFSVPKFFWMHEIGAGKSLSSASLPALAARHPEISPSRRVCRPLGCASCREGMHRVPPGIPGPGSHPGGRLGSPSVTSALGRHPPRPGALCQLGRDPTPCAGRQDPELPKSWRGAGKGSRGSGAAALTHWGTWGQPLPRIDFSVNSPLL